MNIIKPVVLSISGFAAGLLFAEDLTVGVGESVTVSANATYDKVTVNGALAVADGVTLTATTSFVVADGIDGTATLTLGEGASVVENKANGTKFGVGPGRAEVTLGKNSMLKGQGYVYVCYGYTDTPADASAKASEASVILEEGAQIYAGTDLCFGGGKKPSGTAASTVTAIVRLNKDAKISAQRITDSSYTSEIIEFCGGEVVQRTGSSYITGFIRMEYAAKSTSLNLDSVDGQEVRFNLLGGGSYTGFASYGSKECRIFVRGEGDFRKTGAGEFPFAKIDQYYNDSPTDPCLRFLNAGSLVISEGGFVLNAPNILQGTYKTASTNVNVRIDSGAWLDLGGMESVVLGSIQTRGAGLLKNSGTTPTKLTIGADDADSRLLRVDGPVNLIKKGAGKLSLCVDELVSLDVQGGSLALYDRTHVGYPFYRFQVDGHRAGFDSNTRVRINELAFLDKGTDVTRPYVRLYHNAEGSSTVSDPVLLVDGDAGTCYYDMRASYNDYRLERVGVTLEYADCQPIDGYRLAFYDKGNEGDPTAWRVFGGFTATDLEVLAQVSGFESSGVEDGWVRPDFPVTMPSTTVRIPTLGIASGTKVSMAGGTLASETFTAAATGLELDLSSGAAIPLTANQSVARMSIDLGKGPVSLGVLNPEEDGEMRVYGSAEAFKGFFANATSCTSELKLRHWKVYLNDELSDQHLQYVNGGIRLQPKGLIVVLR